MNRHAFTLIELLIVVAIIAILAAIAVPNFLEAQTRSKVSRTVSDMRTIVTALEAYRVDNNKYIPAGPTDGKHQFWLLAQDTSGNWTGVGQKLTTPIAYLTSIPIDVFNTVSGRNSNNIKYASGMYGCALGEAWTFLMQEPPIAVNITGSFYLYSVGPDLTQFGTAGAPVIAAYDPTNGTVSFGDLLYAGGRFISGTK